MAHGTPDQIRAQKQRYKKRYPDKRKKERTRWKRTLVGKRMTHHTFLAIDGEGWNDVEHEYHMIATSDPNLYINRDSPLTTEDCLRFISSIPLVKNRHVVAFFFDYDSTMILRDMARDEPETAAELFNDDNKYVWYRGFGIKYMPHKHLTVLDPRRKRPVTIHDMQGFFQSSFVAALEKYNIGTVEERAYIASMKEERSTFDPEQRQAILEYSQYECRFMVMLAEKIRDLSHAVKLNPYPYEGPGGLASRALGRYYTRERHQETIANMPDAVYDTLPLTMYGGRFETLACGPIPGTVKEYDRHSAYPAIMADLPCLIHGQWRRTKEPARYAFSHVQFHDRREPELGVAYPLPIRRTSGALIYPRSGAGWYWNHEWSGIDTLNVIESHRWAWIPDGCDCHPFEWVRDMFEERERMEAEHKGSGIALKLTLNTLYGKCAQTRPKIGPWCNFAYASIITSTLRRDMYNLYLQCDPMTVFMFATDAIFTTSDLPVSHGLGGLELADTYNDLTIVQPGMYFDTHDAHFKTRGIPRKYVKEYADEICVAAQFGADFPMRMTQFTGLRLGLAQGKLDKIGNWHSQTRILATRPTTKRTMPMNVNGTFFTAPIPNPNRDGGESMPRVINDQDANHAMTDWQTDDEVESLIE